MLAVDPDVDDFEKITRCGSLDPKLVAAGAPEGGFPFLKGRLQSELIGVADDEHLAGLDILSHNGNDLGSGLGDLAKLTEVELELTSFFNLRGHRSTIGASLPEGNPKWEAPCGGAGEH